jgi:deazaflavin-dependent oxidoreductase (nitroreductase family)
VVSRAGLGEHLAGRGQQVKPVACGIGALGGAPRMTGSSTVHCTGGIRSGVRSVYSQAADGLEGGDMPLTGDYAPSAFDFARDQVDLYESSGGAEGAQNPGGKPVIVLTSVGAKTGKLRKTPLMRVEHDGQYAVVASLGGAPKHPVWYYNLTANPRVELQDGPVKKDYQATEVHGEEYAVWFERAVAAWPDYAEYQKKTTRTMPIFVLTPLGAQQSAP